MKPAVAWWNLEPGPERDAARQKYDDANPRELRGPAKGAKKIDGAWIGRSRQPYTTPASECWAKRACLLDYPPLQNVEYVFRDGILTINSGRRSITVTRVAPLPEVEFIIKLITHLQAESNNA